MAWWEYSSRLVIDNICELAEFFIILPEIENHESDNI